MSDHGQKFLPGKQAPQKQQPANFTPLEHSDALEKATAAVEAMKKAQKQDEEVVLKHRKPKRCCGILPCKGRTPNCFYCAVCVDCITGTGCSHNDSTHDPEAYIVPEEG